MINYESTCEITSTDSGKTVTAEVAYFKLEDKLNVVVATNNIVLKYNPKHKLYIGNALGMEFTTKGPKHYEIRQGRIR